MEHRPVDFLHPQKDPPKDAPTPSDYRQLYWRIFHFCVGFVFLLLILWGAGRVMALVSKNNQPPNSSVVLQPKKMGIFEVVKNYFFHSEAIIEGESDDRINILLLGMGGPGHDGPYLTDTNIILSIKPSTHEVAMISIPRDLGVNVPGYGWYKINHVNSFGETKNPNQGGEFARSVFSQTFNTNIPYYIRLDFSAFQEIIDTIGGIKVNVPRSFTDTQFPGPKDSYQTVSFTAGEQIMNGEQALTYARSRHGNNGEGSDFARAARQQLILMALRSKLLSLGTYFNPSVIQKIFSSLSNHLTTNLSLGQMIYLGNMAREAGGITKNLVLDNSPHGYLISTTGEMGAFMLAPKTGNFEMINTTINNIFSSSTTLAASSNQTIISPPVYQTKPTATTTLKIEIQNGTWRVGLANRLKTELENKNFSVISVGNTLKRPVSSTAVYVLNTKVASSAVSTLSQQVHALPAVTLPNWLQTGYDNPNTTEDESGMKYNSEADVLIILGNDFKE